MPLKRKQETRSEPSRKKAKLKSSSTVDSLPWKSVSHLPTAGNFEDDDGILELEEVENIEVVYEDTQAGRVIKFNVSGLLDGQSYVLMLLVRSWKIQVLINPRKQKNPENGEIVRKR
jgi:hypothetical protein